MSHVNSEAKYEKPLEFAIMCQKKMMSSWTASLLNKEIYIFLNSKLILVWLK